MGGTRSDKAIELIGKNKLASVKAKARIITGSAPRGAPLKLRLPDQSQSSGRLVASSRRLAAFFQNYKIISIISFQIIIIILSVLYLYDIKTKFFITKRTLLPVV